MEETVAVIPTMELCPRPNTELEALVEEAGAAEALIGAVEATTEEVEVDRIPMPNTLLATNSPIT